METITFEQIKELFLETREQMKETDKKFQELVLDNDKRSKETDKKFQELALDNDKRSKETDKKFQEFVLDNDKRSKETDKEIKETSRLVKELTANMSGISDSNGKVAEEFFYNALENSLQVGKMKFDYIASLKQKRNNVQGQYDIVLYNQHKVLIIEVKYNFRKKNLQEFYKNIKNFKILFPEYKQYKIFGAIAGMTIEEDAISEANEFGFLILTQNNQSIQLLNDKEFIPNEIK